MIPGDLLSAYSHRQFHTLPGLLDSWAALPNSYPNACMPMQGGSLYHFYDGLWYDPAERRTHDLPCERRTRYRLKACSNKTRQQRHRQCIKRIMLRLINICSIMSADTSVELTPTHPVSMHHESVPCCSRLNKLNKIRVDRQSVLTLNMYKTSTKVGYEIFSTLIGQII